MHWILAVTRLLSIKRKGKGAGMMDYREFVEQVSEDLQEKLSETYQGASVTTRQVDKLQGESYYGISVQPEDSNLGITLNLQGVYEKFQHGFPYDEALDGIAHIVEDSFSNRPNVRLSELMDYASMKEKLMVQVVPTKGNEEMLASIPHKEQEDMSLIYRFVIDSNEQGVASTLITNQILREYGVSPEQLHADAMIQAPEHFPAKIRSMQEIFAEMMGMEPEMMPDEVGMFVATCNDGFQGAGCIFYPEFMDQAADKLQGDFFILPSSLHEVILLPDNGQMDYQELENMVQEINATEVQPQDRLSDSVYHYDAQERIFEKAEKYNARIQEKEAEKERPREKESLKARLDAKKKEAANLDGGKTAPHKVQNAER